jgi:hypothetical protein
MSHFEKARQLDVMKHFSVFLLALVLSAVGALGDMPRGFGRPSDVYMGMLANLTSVESTDKNVIERDGIKLETLVPERVLTIPKNERSAYTPVRFGLRLTNQTSTPVRFSWGSFTPELIRLNGQVIPFEALQISIVLLKEFDFPLVMPQESVTLFWEGKLNWGDNELQLQLPDKYSRLWYFRGFQPGIYQIRFAYAFSSAEANRGYYDSETREIRQLKEVLTGMLSTPWAEFSLVMP